MRILKKEKYTTYKGLRIMAEPELHHNVLTLLNNLHIQKNKKILVLASGTGAFDKRLHDHGYSNIVTADINKDNYQYVTKRIPFLSIDFNCNNFSHQINDTFDIIICLEIIEHLFSPNNFIANCKKLLKKNGTLLISTPNPHGYIARIHTLLLGYPPLFLSNPKKYGHISPIFLNIFKHIISENNMQITKIIPVSHFFKNIIIYTYRTYPYYAIIVLCCILFIPIYPFLQNKQKGALSIFLITHKKNFF